MTIRIEYMRIDELEENKRNPKSHDLAAIEYSYNTFGYRYPVMINEPGEPEPGEEIEKPVLLAGHGRLKKLRELYANDSTNPPDGIIIDSDGMWRMPVLRGKRFNEESEALAYLVASNELVRRGGWRDDLFLEAVTLIKERSDIDIGMLSIPLWLYAGEQADDVPPESVKPSGEHLIRLRVFSMSAVQDIVIAVNELITKNSIWGARIDI